MCIFFIDKQLFFSHLPNYLLCTVNIQCIVSISKQIISTITIFRKYSAATVKFSDKSGHPFRTNSKVYPEKPRKPSFTFNNGDK